MINPEASVTKTDQEKINEFARRAANSKALKLEMSELENSLRNLDDANVEVMMKCDSSEDRVPFSVGNMFVLLEGETALDLIRSRENNVKNELKKRELKLNEHDKTLSSLKAALYSRLGSNINLDE